MTHPRVREPNSFGKRKEPHSIVVTRNGRTRHYKINSFFLSIIVGFVVMFSVGYFAATTYLVMRDDLIVTRTNTNADKQREYEERIATLRTRLDQVTSRQLLDQQAIEAKVAELIERQKLLGARGPRIRTLMEKAEQFGLKNKTSKLDQTVTGSVVKEKQASLMPSMMGFSLRGLGKAQNFALAAQKTAKQLDALDLAGYRPDSPLFIEVANSMTLIDGDQKRQLNELRKQAVRKYTKFAKLMRKAGARVSRKPVTQTGGPFEPLDQSADFSSHLEALGHSLQALEDIRTKISKLPVANPVPGNSLSSRYGSRIDPFKGTYAMHSGLDFKAKSGTPVLATGDGKVVHAGRKGGYGRLVEIKHANGVTTRYAHLSRILVKKGQWVSAKHRIGKVGSSGRSTGPHLHYEVRVGKKAVNPANYLVIGRKLAKLL